MTPRTEVDVIAFYLPQFHPTRENDDWWGEGFTEWTNVAAARPLFPGHQQPRLPGRLGFYDLRLDETRVAQAELASSHGVTAFCYWHYWFGNGTRVLERPFQEVLDSGKPDFQFCLGWANQTWTGIWHGDSDRVLIEQKYGDHDDEQAHFEFLARAFQDDRYYYRVGGRPLFYIYRPRALPDARAFTSRFRAFCEAKGVGNPYLIGETRRLAWRPSVHGFDAAACINMTPDWVRIRRAGRKRPFYLISSRTARFTHRNGLPLIRSYRSLAPHLVWSFEEFGLREMSFPTVVPGWDNTALHR